MTQQESPSVPSGTASRRLARLLAVQALYRASYGEETPEAAINGVLNDAPEESLEGTPDNELLNAIVLGVTRSKEDLMTMLGGSLDARTSPERLETLLRHILLAGVFELHAHAEIAAGIIINDYIDVARVFYASKEPGLVNAVLDNLAKKLR